MIQSINNSSPNINSSPGEPKTKTFRSVAQNLDKPNTFTDLGKAYSNNLYYNTGFDDSKYDEELNFDSQFDELDPIGSINENRAQSQSDWLKAGALIPRALNKAASEIIKMPGVVGGIIGGTVGQIEDLATGEDNTDFVSTAFNNEWVKAVDKISLDINNDLLPVYVKKAVSDGNLWDNISSIDFWATEGADGIGFMASMLAPGAALKSLNLGEKIMGSTAKGISIINGQRGLAGATEALSSLGVTAEGLDLTAITLANTMFEAGSEAGSAMNNFETNKDNFITNQILQGVSQEDAEQLFTEQKSSLGRDIFVSNLAILLVPNAIQSNMIWGKAGTKKLVQQTLPSFGQQVGNVAKNTGKVFASEGFFEEGMQSTVETMFSKSAEKGKLTNNTLYDFNIGELADNYLDTVSSTNGQKAIFLGGVLGGGMYAYSGLKQDKANRERTNQLIQLTESKVNNFNTINETDPYIRDEQGQIIFDENNKPIYDPVAVNKIAKAFELTEQENTNFEEAVSNGDERTVQQIKESATTQLIIPFINKGKMGLDALQQYLDANKTTTEVQTNDADNTTTQSSEDIVKNIMDKATYLQEAYQTYKDFSSELINLNNPLASEQDYTDFYNQLADTYLSYKGDEFVERKNLENYNFQKSSLIKELERNQNLLEENSNFIEGTTEEIYKNNKINSDPRIKKLNQQIEESKNKLKEVDFVINDFIWNSEDVNRMFEARVNYDNKLREDASPENQAIVEEAISQIDNAVTEDEVTQIPTPNTSIKPIVEKAKEAKIIELQEEQIIANNIEREEAISSEINAEIIANTNVNNYDILQATEGSEFSDDIIPTNNDNNSLEEVKSINTGDIDNGKGVKVISTNKSTGLPLDFITEQFPKYLEFEREPTNKIGREVKFEINQNPGINEKALEALKLVNNNDFSNIELLQNYLPINIRFTDEVNAPIETKRKNGEYDEATRLLRIDIVSKLMQGYSINDLKGTIQGQYKGLLKVSPTENAIVPENNLLGLNAVKDFKYLRDNLYVVNNFGQLQNIINGTTQSFMNPFSKNSTRNKENAKGEIYLIIPQANGKPFPLKLNVKKISENNANIIFDIYKEIMINEKSFNTTLNEVNENLRASIEENLIEELNVIGGTKSDIKLFDIVDLMIYSNSDNIKSQMRIVDNQLYFGNQIATVEDIDIQRENIINFLTNVKRHQIKISPKSEIDNTKTNIQSNSADYLKYLVNNNILNTNAVVNEPTFQGYTNIYINPSVSTIESFKPIVDVKGKLSKLKTISDLTESWNSMTPQQQSVYKPLFTERRNEIENNISSKVKIGEGGVEVPADMFTELDFGDSKSSASSESGVEAITETIPLESGAEIISEEILDSNNMIGKIITANQPFNKGSITGEIESIKSNKIKKGLFSIKLTNGEKISWQEGSNNFTWVAENNTNNNRISQENFVPLSEIEGTMENKEITKLQDEIYEVPQNPRDRKQDIDRMLALNKKIQKGAELRPNELINYNKFKNAYQQEFEKRCK